MKTTCNFQIEENFLKNTNSSIGETLGRSDGIIEKIETF